MGRCRVLERFREIHFSAKWQFCVLQVSLLFEVEDLAVASPATVSRCGMVYNNYSDLTWKPYVQSWMEKRQKVWDAM